MFCRIIYNKIVGFKKESEKIKPKILLKNSKNDIIHFSINKKEMNIDYFEDNLLIKKIPKDQKELLSEMDVYVIIFDNGANVLIQPIYNCRLVTSDDGCLIPRSLNELDESSCVLFYDENYEDYYLNDIMSINNAGPYKNLFINTPEDKKVETLNFNDYIIGTESGKNKGVILNNLLII